LPQGTYRLPSEAEWEYACRAGTVSRFSFGADDAALMTNAWYEDNSALKSHPVGEKPANPWDLFDMHGNVWEWTADSLHESYEGAPADGSAWIGENDLERILRGGSWASIPGDLRAARRSESGSENRSFSVGLRVARTLSS